MFRFSLALVVLFFVGTGSATALDTRKNGNSNRIAGPDDRAVQQAITHINKRYQGRVLSAAPVKGAQGKQRIRVKFLSQDGVVRILFFDPPAE